MAEQQQHIDYLNSVVRDELIKASVAMYNAKPANKHQFLADYFAKLSAEREGGAAPAAAEQKQDGGKQKGGKQEPKPKQEKAPKEKKGKGGGKEENKEAAAAPADAGKKEAAGPKPPAAKKVKMALSDVIIEVTPDTEIDPFDWEEVKKDIADILIDGVLWPQSDFTLQDFVFGLKKLIVICQIMDARIPSTSVVVDALKQVRGVGGAEMVSIECAAVDWEAEKTGRKGTKKPKLTAEQEAEQKAAAAEAAAAKGGKKGKGGNDGGKKKGGAEKAEGGGKKKGKEAAEPAARLVTKQMIDKDAKKIIEAAKDSTFFVASVPEMDGSAQTDVSIENLQEALKQVRAKLPNVGLMLVAAGSTTVTILADLPAAQSATVSASDWVASTGVAGTKGNATQANVSYVCNPDNGEFPIKMKDGLTAGAFTFLKKAGALDEGSEEEFYDAPDAGGY